MEIEIITFLLVVALAFILAGWLLKETKESMYMFLTGFVIVLVTGIIVASTGLDFTSAIIINNNAITTQGFTTPGYVNVIASLSFILAGLWGTIVMSLYIPRASKLKEGEDYDA